MSVPKCVTEFNIVLKGMIKCVANCTPDSNSLTTLEPFLSDIIDAAPEEPISLFVTYIFKNDTYRESLLKGDDKFFTRTQQEELDTTQIGKMFDFRLIWKDIDENVRQYIRKCMAAYIKLCIKYIDLISKQK